jgi:hypothetical protein
VALQLYNRKYWFPSGALAANVPARVFVYDNNVFANIFADQAGTIPLPNPTSTDGAGFLTFWAEEGQYWVHIDAETFLIDVGLSEEQADLSTGVASGGEMDINGLNPLAVDIAPVVGYVVDNNAETSVEPTVVKVDEPAKTVVLDAASQLRAITFWLVDSTGTVIQQGFPPDATQRRTHLQLGATLFDPAIPAVIEAQTTQVNLSQPVGQLVDLMESLGPFNIVGNEVAAIPGTLGFSVGPGQIFARGLHHYSGGVLTDSPHINPTAAVSPALFKRVIRVTESPLPPDVTVVDPTQYDNAGVLAPVGGGTNTATILRVYRVPNQHPSAQIAVQYGQRTFASLTTAVAAIGTAPFAPNPVSLFGALIGYIVVIRTATNLADPAQATFVQPTSKLPTH